MNKKLFGHVMVNVFFIVSISSLSICSWFFMAFILSYGCFLLFWAVEWPFNLVAIRNKIGFSGSFGWFFFIFRVADIRDYGISFFNCMLQGLWFTLLVWFGFATDRRRRVWHISLTLSGLLWLVSLDQTYPEVCRRQEMSYWSQVYEFFWNINKERLCLSLENVFGFGDCTIFLSNIRGKDMVRVNGFWVCSRMYFYNRDTFLWWQRNNVMDKRIIPGLFTLGGSYYGANPYFLIL